MKKAFITGSLSLLVCAGCWNDKETQEEPASAPIEHDQDVSLSDDSLVRTEESPEDTQNMSFYGPGIGPDRTGPKP